MLNPKKPGVKHMASIRVKINTGKKNKDGHCPVQLRAIHRRKQAVKTLFYIHSDLWDKNSVKYNHPEAAYLNNTINKELHLAHERLYDFERQGRSFESRDLLHSLISSALLVDCIEEYHDGVTISNRRYSDLLYKENLLFILKAP